MGTYLTDLKHRIQVLDDARIDVTAISMALPLIGYKYPSDIGQRISTVVNFAKHGKTIKEIEEFFNLSGRIIDTHRDNIWRKLGIKYKNANLKSWLVVKENVLTCG